MPTISLSIDVDIDDEHQRFLEEIDSTIDGDAAEMIEDRLSEGIGPQIEQMIYSARQKVKYES